MLLCVQEVVYIVTYYIKWVTTSWTYSMSWPISKPGWTKAMYILPITMVQEVLSIIGCLSIYYLYLLLFFWVYKYELSRTLQQNSSLYFRRKISVQFCYNSFSWSYKYFYSRMICKMETLIITLWHQRKMKKKFLFYRSSCQQ